MKKFFEKNKKKILIGGIIAGVIAVDGTVALWSKGMEGFEYLVQDLS